MKKIILIPTIFLLLTSHLQAKILTVSNVVGSVAMYTSVQTAVDNASLGDTVLVYASGTNYGAVSIKKRIVLMGEGGIPDYSGVSSSFSGITIDSLAGVPVSGTVVIGIWNDYYIRLNGNIKGVIIKNCYSNITITSGSGHIFVNNIFASNVNLSSNCIFSNNIVNSYVSAGSNCIIANNNFIYTGYAFSALTNCTIVNNIIISSNSAISGGVGNSYSKNIQAGTDLPAGNFTGVAPINVFNESTISASMSAAQYLTARWTQLPASVAKKAGTDGKDIGVYGGTYPWPSNKIFNGDPGLPKVSVVVLQNAVISPNGTLLLDFKAKSASTK